MKQFFTFGQGHAHHLAGVTYDPNTIVEIEADTKEAARDKMIEAFGKKWAFQYDELPDESYWPYGYVVLKLD